MGLSIAMLLHKSVLHDSRVRREAKALVEAGHEVTVVELDLDAYGSIDGARRVSASPPPWVKRGIPFHLYRAAFLIWFVARILRLRPDVVHAHDAAMLLPGLAGARLTGAKLVYDSHELATGVPYRSGAWAAFVAWIERVAVPRADAVITVSDGIAERLQQRHGLERVPAVVRNVTDLAPAQDGGVLRRRLGIGDAPLILHQGAPAPDRGGEQLIAALAHLPGAQLAFLGSSPFGGFEDGLRDRAARLGVASRVHFLPSVPLGELLEWTAGADVGVSLLQDTCENHRLALPNKVFEYVAAGVPVVGSDLPALADLIGRHGIGWTVRPDRPEAVAAGLRSALEHGRDPQLRERLEVATRELAWSRERRRLTDVYEALGRALPRAAALVLVRNAVLHDARVHREAETLTAAGWQPVVVGVVSDDVRERRGHVGEAPLVRLAPRSALGRVRDLARRRGRAAPSTVEPARADRAAGSAAPAPRGLLRAHRALGALDFYRLGVGAVRALRPALLHCNDWNTMWVGVAAKAVWRTPVVYDAHELWPDRNGRWESRPWLLACEALFTRVADEVVTTSPGYADELRRRYRVRRPTVIRNVPAGPAPGRRDGPAGEAVLAYVGGLLPGRGLELAIEALARTPGARLELIGPGAAGYVAALAEHARRHGVRDRVEFPGAVAPGRVVERLAGADVGLCLIEPICLSYELTLPNKLFEYAAAGLPILATDLPTIADTVRTWDAGEVVPHDDPGAVAAGLARLLLDPERYRRAAHGARALAAANPWSHERDRLAEVYARVAGGT